MAVKTITIDLEAYELLARHRRPGQSFSQVIKARFVPRPTPGEFRALLPQVSLADDTRDAIDRQVRSRRRSPARAPKL